MRKLFRALLRWYYSIYHNCDKCQSGKLIYMGAIEEQGMRDYNSMRCDHCYKVENQNKERYGKH